MIDKDNKSQLVEEFRQHDSDTGSDEVQVAILTSRIRLLTEHLKVHRKDVSTRVGLLNLVSQRRRLLKHLTRVSVTRYHTLIKQLGLRR